MKLVDEKKQFAFIKNGIVKIDNNLEKYQKLTAIQEAKKELPIGAAGLPMSDAVGLTRLYEEDESPAPSNKTLDKTLRDICLAIHTEGFGQYLLNKDADNFNAAIRPILLGEVKSNDYSLYIPDRNWDVIAAEPAEQNQAQEKSLVDRIRGFFDKKKEEERRKKGDKEPVMTVLDFMDIIHVEAGKEKEFADRIAAHFTVIEKAKKMGQTAVLDQLCQGLMIHIYESILAGHGMCKYITFQDIVNLQDKCERVVDIDYVSNFGRVIPTEVIEKKEAADKLGVFDNYCVLYYDPTEKMTKESSKKEAKAKRDPILFGLINHSEKLYYIDSWIDELCDLTLDEVVKKIGEDAVKELPLE